MKINKFLLSVMILIGPGHVIGAEVEPCSQEEVVTIEMIKAVCKTCVLKLDDFAKYENLVGQFIFENGRRGALMCILYTLGEAKKDQLDQEKMKKHLSSLNESLEKMNELLVTFEDMIKNSDELGLKV
jgi:hypothetical protein